MRIASVPGFHAATKHRTVIFFGVFHEPSVLLGEEEFVVGDAAVAARVRNGTLLQLDQLPEHFFLAGFGEAERCSIAVRLRVLAEMIEARVAVARPPGCVRVDLVQISQHGLHRGMQAVEIEAVESGLHRGRHSLVVFAQPTHEIEDVGIAPHPRRKALETGECFLAVGIIRRTLDVAVHPVCVRPVGLDGNGREAFLLDQALGDLRALLVELVRSVRRLAEQDEARVPDQCQQRIVILRRPHDPVRNLAQGSNKRRIFRSRHRGLHRIS